MGGQRTHWLRRSVLVEVEGFGETEPDRGDFIGRIGNVQGQILASFASFVEGELAVPAIRTAGYGSVSRVAVVPGSGGSFVGAARALGADVVVTGDVSHHIAASAVASGMAVIDPGHAPSEMPGMRALLSLVQGLVQPVVDLIEISTDPWA